jgi:hypothetical protein
MGRITRNNDGQALSIEVPRHITPDFCTLEKRPSYANTHDYYIFHFCIDEGFLVSEETNDNWAIKEWGDTEFISIKIANGTLYYLDRRSCWTPHVEATKAYMNLLADKELLGES